MLFASTLSMLKAQTMKKMLAPTMKMLALTRTRGRCSQGMNLNVSPIIVHCASVCSVLLPAGTRPSWHMAMRTMGFMGSKCFATGSYAILLAHCCSNSVSDHMERRYRKWRMEKWIKAQGLDPAHHKQRFVHRGSCGNWLLLAQLMDAPKQSMTPARDPKQWFFSPSGILDGQLAWGAIWTKTCWFSIVNIVIILMFELATWRFGWTRREQVSPRCFFFWSKWMGELWELTRGRLPRALENPSEPLSKNPL